MSPVQFVWTRKAHWPVFWRLIGMWAVTCWRIEIRLCWPPGPRMFVREP